MTADPRSWFIKAQGALRTGNRDGARVILEQGLAEHPQEAGLHHAMGKWHLDGGDAASAAEWFGKACGFAPDNAQFAVDHAIALSSAGRFTDALTVLQGIEAAMKDTAPYCSTRAFTERGGGNLAAAAKWYDRALELEPGRPRALQGRATVALERGEPDAVQLFDATLARDRGDVFQWHGKAQALDVAGRTTEARQIAESLVKQAPQWTDGLKFLAQLRLAAGESDYTSHYADAASKVPQDPNIPYEHATQLAGLENYDDALKVVRQARRAFPKIEHFSLMEATFAGALGHTETTERLLSKLSLDNDQRWTQEARHAVRLGDFERAEDAVQRSLAHDPFGITAWAIRGILWRISGDPRAEWLHGQTGLVAMIDLHDSETVLPPAVALLHHLHENSPMPLGQSLRGGSQTRGNLFDRHEPEFRQLHDAVMSTLEEYRAGLPAQDDAHPLLRHRAAPWAITGSWSVRLSGGGDCHASHIHPAGIISSALYCELPEEVSDHTEQAGWIDLGRPSIDLPLEIEPLYSFQPRVGALALFPSTLYHGTRPFTSDRRMTVAFDVTEKIA